MILFLTKNINKKFYAGDTNIDKRKYEKKK